MCSLLTFVTGRRVAVAEELERYSPHAIGDHACIPIESLWAAATAWSHRQEVVDQGLTYALLLYNEAYGQGILQSIAALYNTALNGVLDRSQLKTVDISLAAKNALKAAVQVAVESCEHVSKPDRAAMQNALCSRIEQGLSSSLTDRLAALLEFLGIFEDIPQMTSEITGRVRQRIQFVNAVRNRLTHAGDLPKLKGPWRGT